MRDRSIIPAACLLACVVALAIASGPTWIACRAADETAPAPAPADVELSQRVQQALADLDANSRATRLAAEQRLRDWGPRILPLLPAADQLPSEAVRTSVARIRNELEREQALKSLLPKHVTLRGRATVRDWLQQLQQQTGNECVVSKIEASKLDRVVELAILDVEYWPVLDQLARHADSTIDLTPLGLSLGPAPEVRERVTYSGAFRIALRQLERRNAAGDSPRELIRVELAIMIEPRLRPLYLQYEAADFTLAMGETILENFAPEARLEQSLGRGQEGRVELLYVWPGGDSTKTLRLAGHFKVTTAAGREPVIFPRITDVVNSQQSPRPQRRGGAIVDLRRAWWSADGRTRALHVEVNVAIDQGGPAFESYRSWLIHNEAYMTDGAARVPPGGIQTSFEGDGIGAVEYTFSPRDTEKAADLNGWSFVYVLPTLIVDAPGDVRFDALPVP